MFLKKKLFQSFCNFVYNLGVLNLLLCDRQCYFNRLFQYEFVFVYLIKLFIYSLALHRVKNVTNNRTFQINAVHSLNTGVV